MHDVEYLIIIDTDSYAGNFERQLCAYITGQIGDCGVGDRQQRFAKKELNRKELKWFENHVMPKPDEHGCNRPVEIVGTPGYFNDGMGGAYTDQDDPKFVYDRYVKAVEDYYLPHIKTAEEKVAAGNKDFEPELKSHKKTILDARKNGPGKYPSCQSVAIFLNEKPPENFRELVGCRAEKFSINPEATGESYLNPFEILAVRFVKRTTVVTEEEV